MRKPEQTIPVDSVNWETVKIHKIHADGPADQHPYLYTLKLPDFLAKWDVWDYWERERFDSMIRTLTSKDTLFDIGTEFGWWTALLAQQTKARMVLMEPTPEFWPGIKAVWEHNGLTPPAAAVFALVGDKQIVDEKVYPNAEYRGLDGSWPDCANTGQMINKIAYRYLHDAEDAASTPMITIDEFVDETNVKPTALTMDTEGAEILILRGAERTLREYHPIIWASLHPDLAIRDGYGDVQNVHDFLTNLGYHGEWLATDHEEHWVFTHPEGRKAK